LIADAITYAEDGFPVTAEFAAAIEQSVQIFHSATPAREVFLPGGSPPREGQVLSQPRLARTLRAITAEGPAVFYRGALAEELIGALRNIGGIMTLADLDEHEASWEEPLFTQYRDIKVCELPPNSQGVIALMMLQMLQQLPAQSIKEGEAGYIHLLAEVARLAYADREACLSDPEHMTVASADLLSERYARSRAAHIEKQAMARALQGIAGDTVYVCVADAEGNLVSLNQSNWMGFGSGVMAGETGVMLHNRGAWFSLEPGHANVIAPRKRTMHTLMPGMAFRDGEPWLLFGTMGGSAQAQIHVQLLTRIVDQDMAIDEALDAPRFDAVAGTDATGRPVIAMEGRFPTEVVDELRRRGHAILMLPPYSSTMGHAHIIQISDRIYAGASDPRTHSLALGF
jgi:gamma-glutamyltranspeptidase/glutathione hydrolase